MKPACSQSICIKYKTCHDVCAVSNTCFLKNIENRNYPVLCDYDMLKSLEKSKKKQ